MTKNRRFLQTLKNLFPRYFSGGRGVVIAIAFAAEIQSFPSESYILGVREMPRKSNTARSGDSTLNRAVASSPSTRSGQTKCLVSIREEFFRVSQERGNYFSWFRGHGKKGNPMVLPIRAHSASRFSTLPPLSDKKSLESSCLPCPYNDNPYNLIVSDELRNVFRQIVAVGIPREDKS